MCLDKQHVKCLRPAFCSISQKNYTASINYTHEVDVINSKNNSLVLVLLCALGNLSTNQRHRKSQSSITHGVARRSSSWSSDSSSGGGGGLCSVQVQQEALDGLRQGEGGDEPQACLPQGPAHSHPTQVGQPAGTS